MNMSEKIAAFAAATNNELFDTHPLINEWSIDAVETHETLEQWLESSQEWRERSLEKRGEIAGFQFLAWKSAQPVKGQPRRSISVVDFGDVRFALETDLSNFV